MAKSRFMESILVLLVFGLPYVMEISCDLIHIVPTAISPCQIQPCMTLNEYAANTSQYSHTNTTTLILTQGHHTLDVELSLSNITDISISGQELDNVTITCFYPGRLEIMNVDHLYISMLRFEQCDNNEILSVDEFLLEDSVFTHGTSTILVLNEASGEIRNVNISDTLLSPQTQAFGAVIYCNHSSVVINETIFERNIATDGGAIFMDSQNNVTIIDSIFLSNSATRGGALFAKHYNNITLQLCKFMSNGFSGTSIGGGIVLHQSLLSVVNCSFQDNRASAGAVIFSQSQSEVNISKSFFTDNSAYLSGGVIHGEDRSIFTVELSEFTRNSANQNGGVFYLTQSDLTVTSSSFEESTTLRGGVFETQFDGNISIVNSIFHRNSALILGGVLHAEMGINVEISNSSFSLNTCPSGGVISADVNCDLTIHSSDFSSNGLSVASPNSIGGAFAIRLSRIMINESNFISNVAYQGGALILLQSHLQLAGSSFSANIAFIGGALSLEGSLLSVENSAFLRNQAYYGGTLASRFQTNVSISDGFFIDNSAEVSGGVAYGDGRSSFTVELSDFDGNIANQRGGAFFLSECDITINNSSFEQSSAQRGGVIETQIEGIIVITNSMFQNNQALQGGILNAEVSNEIEIRNGSFLSNTCPVGGVVYAAGGSTVSVTSSDFRNNGMAMNEQGTSQGGAFMITQSSITVTESTFVGNVAKQGGAFHFVQFTTAVINDSFFSSNLGHEDGGALYIQSTIIQLNSNIFDSNIAVLSSGATVCIDSILTDFNNTYSKNIAYNGGAISMLNCFTSIKFSSLNQNAASYVGGAFAILATTNLTIVNSTFVNNTCTGFGGALGFLTSDSVRHLVSDSLHQNITLNNFTSNEAYFGGAICLVNIMSTELSSNLFKDNYAYATGGAIYSSNSNVSLSKSNFENNSAAVSGGVIVTFGHGLNTFKNLNFTQNSGNAGIVTLYESETVISGKTLFQENKGSLTVIASEIKLLGTISFVNCASPDSRPTLPLEQGGAITLFQSIFTLQGTCIIRNNSAETGGGIYATESRLLLQGNAELVDNKANISGGGAYLYQSEFAVFGNCTFERNRANENGGGVYAIGSAITKSIIGQSTIYPGSSYLNFRGNEAIQGGAVYLKGNAKLYTYKFQSEDLNIYGSIGDGSGLLAMTNFFLNIADLGGAVYIDDDSTLLCNNDPSELQMILSECQLQTLAVYDSSDNATSNQLRYKNTFFSNNTALLNGDNIYGGLFDRCTVSPLAELLQFKDIEDHLNGLSYLQLISDIQIEDSIASNPVRVCSCENNFPDCSSDVEPIRVKKGHTFYVSIIAVDQIGNPKSSTFQSYLLSTEGRLSEQPKPDNSNSSCHTLSFSISSPNNISETLIIYANGPCNDAVLSRLEVEVEFLPCHCPVGFMSADNDEICECFCDSMLEEHTTSCNSTTETFVKSDNSWIGFINEEDNSSLTVHMHCPYNYCKPPNTLISLRNSTYPLCNFSRKGILCGACMQNYSLSLGSSRCLKCPNYWPGTLVTIILAALISGIVLIIMILVLNLTVAVGTINAVVFYANIIASNYSSFFFGSENSFQSVLTSWLNLNFGLDVCFFEGMDAYWKTWIKMVFPAYIIIIVVIIITLSECSDKFSHLIGKRNPVATLATLILLSYTTFLQVVIAAFSFTIVDFQNGSIVPVWLPDGNVKYLQGKHIALFIAAIVILLMVVSYTLLLFSWQWLLPNSEKKIFRWIIENNKIRPFMEAYLAPYKDKHRYWTGLLLLVRVILYLVSAGSVFGGPQIQLISVVVVVGFLLLLKSVIVHGVYKNWPVDVLENILLFNILLFGVFTMYTTAVNGSSQFAISLTSTIVTAIALLIIIVYHLYVYILKPNGMKSPKSKLTSCLKTRKENLNQIRQIPTVTFTGSTHQSNTDSGRFNDIVNVMTPPGTLDYRVQNHLTSNPNQGPTFSSLILPDPESIQLKEMSAQKTTV